MQNYIEIRSCLGFLATLLLAACGGGGDSSAAPTPTPTASPTVTLTSSAASVASGSSITLTWSSTDATSCTASGGWAGAKATSGSESVGPLDADVSYALSCSGAGGSANQTAAVTVTAQVALQVTSGAPPNGNFGTVYDEHQVRLPGICYVWQQGCVVPCVPTSLGCRPASGNATGYRYMHLRYFPLSAAGGTPPYSWTWAPASGSSLPPGLTLSSSSIAGTPTAAGTYDVVVTVADSASPAVQKSESYAITIAPPPPPVIKNTAGPAFTLNIFYAGVPFTVTSSAPPGTWSETGMLPPGMLFSGNRGVLSGTPTSVGSFPIKIMMQDAAGQNAIPLEVTIQVLAKGFTPTGSMATARDWHTATLLEDGTVLITGGINETAASTIAERFDPASESFSATGSMTSVRVSASATLLNNGMVLLAGGKAADGTPLATAELFDPASRSFVPTGSMAAAHVYHTATLLGDGRVLLIGGIDASSNPIATAEIFDPSRGTFAPAGSVEIAGGFRTATLLKTGKVLVAGGLDGNGSAILTAELFDPIAGTFAATANMSVPRAGHTATPLINGKVLVIGGALDFGGDASSTAELFDPVTESFTPTGSMATGRALHTAMVLTDGRVLVAGGGGAFYRGSQASSLSSAELFDPASESFAITTNMTTARESHTTTLLKTGDVLVTGGADGTLGYSPATVFASAELYEQ